MTKKRWQKRGGKMAKKEIQNTGGKKRVAKKGWQKRGGKKGVAKKGWQKRGGKKKEVASIAVSVQDVPSF